MFTISGDKMAPSLYTPIISIPYSKGVMFIFLRNTEALLFTKSPFLHT
jgi:hypothetical protein